MFVPQTICHYCKEIKEYEEGYPLRKAKYSNEGIIHRCSWHAQFQCSKCEEFYHYSWLYWCPNKEKLICGKCSHPELEPLKFWGRTYAYSFNCECGEKHNDLFYQEFQGLHPWQLEGKESKIKSLIEKSKNENWTPNSKRKGEKITVEQALKIPNKVFPLRKQSQSIQFHSDHIPEEEINYEDTYEKWLKNSETWIEAYNSHEDDQGDINRQLIIDPFLWKQIGEVKDLKVFDAGCGNGYLVRELARKGAKVVGVDHSDEFIAFCEQKEQEEPLGCIYNQGSLANLSFLEDETFDLVVSNIVIVDVLEYKKAFKEINRILKPKGRFVWSNLHPTFGRAIQLMYRLPHDSQRNEERQVFMFDRYFDTGGILISWGKIEPIWQFERTLSDYSKALKEANFVIQEIVEPKPSNELLQKYPREIAFDADRVPCFIIYDCLKYE